MYSQMLYFKFLLKFSRSALGIYPFQKIIMHSS